VGLCDDVRAHCASVAATARSVTIDRDALAAYDAAPAAHIDPQLHDLAGDPENVARGLLTLDTINFGSGWFPTLRKDPGRSGYATIARAMREHGPLSNAQLRAITAHEVATILRQRPDHELMALYAQALRALGSWLGARSALEAVAGAGGSAQALAAQLASGMALFDDRGYYKRAQIVPANLALAGVADLRDLDRLTIFADNLVPHVLRCDGVLHYEARLAAHIDAGRDLRPGPQEREIRACAVVACEELAARLGVAPRILDSWLWNRGAEPAYKARPRHRCRCVWY
jgi:Potential Queuosine, Q, salvage protein family